MPFDLDPSTVCHASKAEVCFCADAATKLGAIAIATDDGMSVRVDAIHGDPGGIVVGQSLALPDYFPIDTRTGDRLFLSILPNPTRPEMHTFSAAFRIDDDELVLGCDTAAPPLASTHAIEAALAVRCDAHLGAIDDQWVESQCDDGGCSIGGGSTFATALVVALIARDSPRRVRGWFGIA